MQNILKAKDVMSVGMRGYKEYIDYNWHGKIISIKNLLSRDEYIKLIHDIGDMCISQDGNFVPEMLDFSVKLNIIINYALVEMPDDLDDIYELIYYSDLYNAVLKNISKSQVNSVLRFFGMGGDLS